MKYFLFIVELFFFRNDLGLDILLDCCNVLFSFRRLTLIIFIYGIFCFSNLLIILEFFVDLLKNFFEKLDLFIFEF